MRQIVVAATMVGALITASDAQAGFLDDFARAFLGPPQQVANSEPLEMTVKKRRRHSVSATGQSSRPQPVVRLDPATDPNWFLRDPTLRRGDIVVTRDSVLVYNGRNAEALRPADFVALGTGKSGPRKWQHQLKTAARSGRSYFELGAAIKPAAPVQTSAEAPR